MIAYKGMPKATPADFARMDLLREMHCMACAIKGDFKKQKVEIHHLKRGNKRMGHLYTIPLCNAHHQGNRGSTEPAVHRGMKAFRAAFGYDDWGLWQKLQVMLGLDDSLPPSKIYKRPASQTEALVTPTGD